MSAVSLIISSVALVISETTFWLTRIKKGIVDDPIKTEQSIRQILVGISSIVQGVTKLRNAYGTRHGKGADFKGPESKYAKFLVGVVSEIAIIFLTTNGETTELIESTTANIF